MPADGSAPSSSAAAATSAWRCQIGGGGGVVVANTKSRRRTTALAAASVRSSLVPYNTNVFLMQEHEPRDADDGAAEFLSREFSSVYEDARAERLDGMSKGQLVREYLQMEANYDKLSRNLRRHKVEADRVRDAEQRLATRAESDRTVAELEGRVRQLLEENGGEFSGACVCCTTLI